MTRMRFGRRHVLLGGASLAGAAMLGGCDRLAASRPGQEALKAGEDANLYVQRLLLSPKQLAPEDAESDISGVFKPNGTENPSDHAYKALVRDDFRSFRLDVSGLVENPYRVSLAELRRMTSRTQITRHDCVEGWSCIGKWTGVPVAVLLQEAGLKPNARYVVFHCADTMEGSMEGGDDTQDDADGGNSQVNQKQASGSEPSSEPDDNTQEQSRPVRYYESIDLDDAFHPQTILAYDMNNKPLPVAHGAPLRLRLERQLGYKMAKYVMRIEVVENFARFGQGRGGYWEDNGYAWYAGI